MESSQRVALLTKIIDGETTILDNNIIVTTFVTEEILYNTLTDAVECLMNKYNIDYVKHEWITKITEIIQTYNQNFHLEDAFARLSC